MNEEVKYGILPIYNNSKLCCYIIIECLVNEIKIIKKNNNESKYIYNVECINNLDNLKKYINIDKNMVVYDIFNDYDSALLYQLKLNNLLIKESDNKEEKQQEIKKYENLIKKSTKNNKRILKK